MPPPDCKAKVLIVGDSGVGKSTILSSYKGERFNTTYIPTVERDIRKSIIHVGKRSVELQIWDTPGNPRYRTLTAAYMQEDFQGVILVFDVTVDESYDHVQRWVETVNEYAGKEHGNYKYVFVGNKNDNELEREVFIESGEQLAKQYSGAYFDASAKTKKNINEIFRKMAELILGETSDKQDLNNGVNERGHVDGFHERKGFRCTVL